MWFRLVSHIAHTMSSGFLVQGSIYWLVCRGGSADLWRCFAVHQSWSANGNHQGARRCSRCNHTLEFSYEVESVSVQRLKVKGSSQRAMFRSVKNQVYMGIQVSCHGGPMRTQSLTWSGSMGQLLTYFYLKMLSKSVSRWWGLHADEDCKVAGLCCFHDCYTMLIERSTLQFTCK